MYNQKEHEIFKLYNLPIGMFVQQKERILEIWQYDFILFNKEYLRYSKNLNEYIIDKIIN